MTLSIMGRIFVVILFLLGLFGPICRATSPEMPPAPLAVHDFGEQVVIVWPQSMSADQTGRAIMTAVDPITGEEKWSFRGPQRLNAWRFVLEVRGDTPLLIVPENSGRSAAFDVRTGAIAWESDTIVACGVDIGMTESGNAINLATGAVVWGLGHPLNWALVGIDRETNRALVGESAAPITDATPITLQVLDLRTGNILARGVVSGLQGMNYLGQRGEMSYVADGTTLIAVNLFQPAAPKVVRLNDPQEAALVKEANIHYSWNPPAPATSWAREGRIAVVDARDSIGLLRIFATDGSLITRVGVSNIADSRPRAMGPAPAAIPPPSPLQTPLLVLTGFSVLAGVWGVVWGLRRSKPAA